MSSFSSTNCVTSPFLVLFVLKISNDLSIGFILIFSSFTSCLSILVWIQPKSISAFSYSSFLLDVLTFVYTFSFLSLSSCWHGIMYWFWELLYTEICCTMPTLNLWQNPPTCCYLHHLNLPVHFCSLSSVLTCNLSLNALLCYIYNTSWSLFLSLAFGNPLLYVYMCCSWNILVSYLCQSYLCQSYLWIFQYL